MQGHIGFTLKEIRACHKAPPWIEAEGSGLGREFQDPLITYLPASQGWVEA